MRQSSVVNEWIDEGHRLTRLEVLEAMRTGRFGPLSGASLESLRAPPDERLQAMAVQLLTAKTLAELGL